MKKILSAILAGFLIFTFNLASAENDSSRKYTPPPARYSPPQTPTYGREPAYTPPPPPEIKKK